eukprot:gene8753-biopygen7648
MVLCNATEKPLESNGPFQRSLQRPNVQRSTANCATVNGPTVTTTVTTGSRQRQRHGNRAATACTQLA